LTNLQKYLVLFLVGAVTAFTAGALIAPVAFRTPRFVTAMGAQAQPVVVPDVTGLTRQDAQRQIESTGLTLAGQWSEYGPIETMGLVIRQDPAPATQVPRGSPMSVFWNVGPLYRTYHPELLPGLPAQEAEELIADWQLYTAGRSRMPHPSVPEGCVIGVCPMVRDSLPVYTAVRLLVSTGWEGIPVFTGMPEAMAESIAAVHEIVLVVGEIEPALEAADDSTVTWQSPDPGTAFIPGDTVLVRVMRSGPVLPSGTEGAPGEEDQGWGNW
jgi:beta-lactam-binding protein with PASTA domain